MKKLFILLTGVFLCVSCVKLNTKYIERNYFLISPGVPEARKEKDFNSDYTVKIMSMYVNADFRGTQFTYKINKNQYMSDYYNCFYITPDRNLQEVIRGWFARSGAFKYSLEDTAMVDTDFIIKPYLIAVFGDYSDITNPQAVLIMGFSFLDNRGKKPVLIFYKDYMVKEKIPNKAPADLVEGWNKALKDILNSFDKDLINLAKESKKEIKND
jgi:hypothetical protein